MAEDRNSVVPEGDRRAGTPGDVPDTLRRRYLTEPGSRVGARIGTDTSLGFYTDVRTRTPAFRDYGRRLATGRNDPQVVRDLVAVARHRGWGAIRVTGHPEFRREVWLQARAAGLEVHGHRPTERDRQHVQRNRGRRPRRPAEDPAPPGAQAEFRVVERVVRSRVVESSEQARILATARRRLVQWLDRGATFGTPVPRDRERNRS